MSTRVFTFVVALTLCTAAACSRLDCARTLSAIFVPEGSASFSSSTNAPAREIPQ